MNVLARLFKPQAPAQAVPFAPKVVALPGRIPTLAGAFLRQIEDRGRSPNTVAAYRRDLEQFAGFLAGRDIFHVQAVSGAVVDDFLNALLHGEGNSPRTVARKLATLRAFFRYCVDRGLVGPQADPARRAGQGLTFHASPTPAPAEKHILSMIDAIPDDTLGLRDRALFYLIYCAALRVSAAIGLDVYDSATPPQWCVLPSGVVLYRAKGGRAGNSLADERAMALLEAGGVARKRIAAPTEAALFVTRLGRRMSRQAVSNALIKRGRAVGLRHLHPHQLRHRRLREITAKAGIQAAHSVSGHLHMKTTADCYAVEANAPMRAQVRRMAPVGGVR